MKDNQILDEPRIYKRVLGKWKGAKYFVLGLTISVVLGALTFALEELLRGYNVSSSVWIAALQLAAFIFLFFNVAGTILSIFYLVSGKNREERFAGAISLLLNLTPYIWLFLL